MDFVRRFILELPTLFLIMHSTDDLAVVLVRLTERWDWIIAAYHSYLGSAIGPSTESLLIKASHP
ncbi:hypothetical protein EV401DRAFT_2074283 [Pisolithus croceorrhizus]|nr:hypothetical protein EV401DRAFT_2074283 [Pisolithus croceorrhizus]